MSSQLQRELVDALQLEQLGVEHPEAVYIALEHAQEELCYATGYEPGQTFSVENTHMQCYNLPNNITQLNETDRLRLIHSILHYTAQDRNPDRIVHFYHHSGQNMVRTHTYENCDVSIGAITVPCFSIATLSLHDQAFLSVIFARVH